jgi:murein DD-endopeptidase MepM/ murein hydrolase activator NlpD
VAGRRFDLRMRRDVMRICALGIAILLASFIFVTPAHADAPIISAGQFVYAPAEAEWDIEAALVDLRSPMAPYAGDVEIYALMSSVDPRVLLTALELEYGLVTGTGGLTRSSVLGALDDVSRRLYSAFYAPAPGDTVSPRMGRDAAGAYALQRVLGERGAARFGATAGRLFPDFNPLDHSNAIDPAAGPPAGLLQFPFPLGDAWQFNGAHGWSGYSGVFSSMDFSQYWPACGLASYDEVVVTAGAGVLRKPRSYADCWLEIDHAGGWTTSYYHLTDVQRDSGPVEANVPLGRVGCETCVGGFASAAHVHFSLKYNGAYVTLDGVDLSGWTVHPGPAYYSTQTWLSRDDLAYYAYSRLINDAGACGWIGLPRLAAPAHGARLGSMDVALQWSPPAGEPAPSSYLVRVRTVADMESASGETVANERVTWTSGVVRLPAGYENRELYWSVQAWRLGACSNWAPAWQFRLGAAATPNPSRLALPLVLKQVGTWPAPPTHSPSATATRTPTEAATATPTATGSPALTPTATGSPALTPTATGSPALTPTATPTLTVTPTASETPATPSPTPAATMALEREAEAGQLAWPMSAAYDADASGLYFVHNPVGLSATGMCRVTVDLPAGGSWELWARGMGLNESADEFTVMLDVGAPLVWQVPIGEWTWELITTAELAAGEHFISFVASEAGARLDVVQMRRSDPARR